MWPSRCGNKKKNPGRRDAVTKMVTRRKKVLAQIDTAATGSGLVALMEPNYLK